MIGNHLQQPVNGWLEPVSIYPPNTPVKMIDNVQALRDAKQTNPACITILRHFFGDNYTFGGSWDDNLQRARDFFATFIDGTFRQYAAYVDVVEEWNEYNANSHTQQEIDERVLWTQAVAYVWENDYRVQSDYKHIRLGLSNTAIGNDIPIETARVAMEYHCYLCYHPYVATMQKQVLAEDWQYYSGRFVALDAFYQQHGITVEWLFTEGGPVGAKYENGGITLLANDGWLHESCCQGDIDNYVEIMRYWADRVTAWNMISGNRAKGVTLFTSGGGERWQWFELQQPYLNVIAGAFKDTAPIPPLPEPIEPIKSTYLLIPPYAQLSSYRVQIVYDIAKNGLAIDGEQTEGEHPISPSRIDAFQSVVWGLDGSLCIILWGDDIGDGITPRWVASNYPQVFPRCRWVDPV